MAFDLKRSVALVSGCDPDVFGTAFAFWRDERGTFLLTCAHVVEDVGGAQSLRVNNILAKDISTRTPESDLDLAVLFVENMPELPVFSLARMAATDQTFHTAGCYRFGKERLVGELHGVLKKHVQAISNVGERANAWHIALLDDEQLQPGFSGAPVLDEQYRAIGVISQRKGSGAKGLAISVEAIQAVWPEMPAQLWQADAKARAVTLVHDWMNCEVELAAFTQIVTAADTETQLIVVHGASGMGKSKLLREYQRLAQVNHLNELFIQLAPQVSVQSCLEKIYYAVGLEHLTGLDQLLSEGRPDPFTRDRERDWHRRLTHALFSDLSKRRLVSRFVVFFDQYEKADQSLREWLNDMFLPGIRNCPLVVVVAGQDEIEPKQQWKGQCHFELNGVTVDWYHRYAQRLGVALEPALIDQFHELLHGCPKQFVEFVQARRALEARLA